MIFYVHFEPEIVNEAGAGGTASIHLLIGILRGFLQNCCIMEFDDGRLQRATAEAVARLPEDFDRRVLKSVLAQMEKLNRFVYCIEPDYSEIRSDLDQVLSQLRSLELDLVLVASSTADPVVPATCEVSTLLHYQGSAFEDRRSRLAASGVICADGSTGAADFMDRHLRKGLRHARSLEICDRMMGKNWGSNYEYTMKQFLRWLASTLSDAPGCRIWIHTERGDGCLPVYFQSQLASFKQASCPSTHIGIYYYCGDSLPHHRGILTDQCALAIDRGMDFLNPKTHRCRDVEMSMKARDEMENLLNLSSSDRIPQGTVQL